MNPAKHTKPIKDHQQHKKRDKKQQNFNGKTKEKPDEHTDN